MLAIKCTKQVDILKYTCCRNIDKVQVSAVSCYSNLVDIAHIHSISCPASEPPCVSHFLCWVSRKLRIFKKCVVSVVFPCECKISTMMLLTTRVLTTCRLLFQTVI